MVLISNWEYTTKVVADLSPSNFYFDTLIFEIFMNTGQVSFFTIALSYKIWAI